MTDSDQERQGPSGPDPQASPDPLRLRARPQPVTRINRKIVIGGAALLLVLISLIVLLRTLAAMPASPTRSTSTPGSS